MIQNIVGYYPPSADKEYTEYTEAGKGDFFSELCSEWEAAAKLPSGIDTRQVVIRTGVESNLEIFLIVAE